MPLWANTIFKSGYWREMGMHKDGNVHGTPVPVCTMTGTLSSTAVRNTTCALGIIGDSVNTASRLEKLARTVDEETNEVVTVISGDTAALLGPEFEVRNIGRRTLEGRHEETEVYVLTGLTNRAAGTNRANARDDAGVKRSPVARFPL